MNQDRYILVRPTMAHVSELVALRDEFASHGGEVYGCGDLMSCEGEEAVANWVHRCELAELEEHVPVGSVPITQFVCERAATGELVGVIQVRRRFNDYYEKYAGNIGYAVRPAARRQGVARWMLTAMLDFCRDDIGLDRVLLLCRDYNEASRRTILACGGVYESTVLRPTDGMNMERYWIEL